jgi:hypothetical protein
MPKTQKQIYIHVGPPKTGTSAIQRCFNDNRSALFDQGIYYPAHDVDSNGVGSGNLLSVFDRNIDKSLVINVAKLESLVDKFKTSTATKLVLSSEFFFKNIELLHATIPSAIFIAYVRNPIHNTESAYNQSVKRHGNVRKIKPVDNINTYTLTLLERVVQKIGRNHFILRTYDTESFTGRDIVSDFSSILNVTTSFAVEKTLTNQSYSFEALEFKRWLNQFELEEITHLLDILLQGYKHGIAEFSLLEPRCFEKYKVQTVEYLTKYHSRLNIFNGDKLIGNIEKELAGPYLKQELTEEQFLSVANYVFRESEFLYIRICQLLYKHSYLPIFNSLFVELFLKNFPLSTVGLRKNWLKFFSSKMSWRLKKKYFIDYLKQKLGITNLSTWSSDSSSVKGVKQLKVRLGIDEVVSNPALLIELALFCEANKNYQFAFYLISEASILAPNNGLIIKKLVEYEGILNHPTPGTS